MYVVLGEVLSKKVRLQLQQIFKNLLVVFHEQGRQGTDLELQIIHHLTNMDRGLCKFLYHKLMCRLLMRKRLQLLENSTRLTGEMAVVAEAMQRLELADINPAITALKVEHQRMLEFRLRLSTSVGADSLVMPIAEREIVELINQLIHARDFALDDTPVTC